MALIRRGQEQLRCSKLREWSGIEQIDALEIILRGFSAFRNLLAVKVSEARGRRGGGREVGRRGEGDPVFVSKQWWVHLSTVVMDVSIPEATATLVAAVNYLPHSTQAAPLVICSASFTAVQWPPLYYRSSADSGGDRQLSLPICQYRCPSSGSDYGNMYCIGSTASSIYTVVQ